MLMDGTYQLTFIGNATLSFPATSATLLNQSYNSVSGATLAYIEIPVGGNGQLWIGFSEAYIGSEPGAKNIVLLQPGCSTGDIFSPGLLQLISRFDSLRFMDWLATNNKLESSWSERRLPDAPSYVATFPGSNTSGVPWEVCISLANKSGKDLWINIPAHATDDYILQLAQLLHNTVDPTLFIYYEYSNEVGNFIADCCVLWACCYWLRSYPPPPPPPPGSGGLGGGGGWGGTPQRGGPRRAGGGATSSQKL